MSQADRLAEQNMESVIDGSPKSIDSRVTTGQPNESNKVLKQYGITSAVNTDRPTKHELAKSREFMEWFKTLDILESSADLNKKLVILEKLNKITKKWIVGFLTKKRMPESEARAVGGHIRTFGSYRLGIHTKGGDIDAVMIVPMHITRKDFYESFATYLRSVGEIKNLRVISEAYVPLMKFTFGDVEFDLLFCRIKSYKIEDDIKLDSPKVLRDMDLRDIRSINGFRIAEEILNLVPSQKNFKFVLHAIRYWAKQNELYSNVLGFFGGITWAILVARICQLYPCAAPSVLIEKFFMAFSNWDWDRHPIVLQKIIYGPYGMTLPQWHLSATDRNKLISIITPTYPEQNTVHNVSLSTRAIITEQLAKASKTMSCIMANKLPWSTLFEPDNFFQNYNHFLIMTTHADSEVKQMEFNGYIESRLRYLVTSLEKNIFIKLVHPYTKSFPTKPEECLPFARRWFLGLAISKPDENAQIQIDFDKNLKMFEYEVLGKANFTMTNPDKKITFTHCRRKELKNFLPIEVIGKRVRKVKKEVHEDIPLSNESFQNLLPLGSKRKHNGSSGSSPEDKLKNTDSRLPVQLNGETSLLLNEACFGSKIAGDVRSEEAL
ncbi:Poly(A) polymerase gamma [Thelohanellus kitauei]|uniref:Poly(A) polymerase n=1 Tax=Thelohanellus kitauei TaxID=669202 RepID=A0A0C2MI72_THEKT|nr:Poly(A) polymerase gamma [Thelohanellus kitauei]